MKPTLVPMTVLAIAYPNDGNSHLFARDNHTLINGLAAAIERFKENAQIFRAYSPSDNPNAVLAIDYPTAISLAELFERQAQELTEFVDVLVRGDGVLILNVEKDEDEMELAA